MQDAEAGQSFTNDQAAVAVSEADQLSPWNVNTVWGVPVASVTQSNTVSADSKASATASLDQELIQGQDGTDGTYQWLGAQQTAGNVQQIAAGTLATQDSAGNANTVSAPEPNQAAVGSVEQGNSAAASATATAVASLVQQLAQFEDADGPGVELIDLTQITDSIQNALIAAVVAQTRTENLDDLVVPAGSRATNPTLRQRNVVSTSVSSENTGDLSSVAFQYQGGAADIELTSGLQRIQLVQSATAYAPAEQVDLRNRAGWLGIEPPLPTPDGGGGTDESAGGPTDSGITVAGRVAAGGLIRENAPFLAGPSRPAPVLVVVTPGHHTLLEPRLRPAPPFTPPDLPSTAAPPPQSAGSPAFSRPAGSPAAHFSAPPTWVEPEGRPVTSVHDSATIAHPLPESPGTPDDPFSAGAATSSSAPSSGSGQTVVALSPFKLAAQLVTGPQMPTSVLGRPVIFLEPFERPG
jgi:hypothetical protein